MKFPKFDFIIFFITTTICGILTFITLLAAAARDEGTAGDGIVVVTLEKLFYIFRFPTHTLLFDYMDGSIFFVGLFMNCLFYGLIIERIYSFYKNRKYEQ